MSLKSVVITGANRGIGLEFVRQLLAAKPAPQHLIATSRQDTNEELDKLRAKHSSLHVLKLEIKNFDSYPQFVQQVEQIVGADGVDTLINNAGILINKDLESVTADQMIENFEVNTVSPLMLTKAFLPLLKVPSSAGHKSAVINITSTLGLMSQSGGGLYPYRTSKAALNMVSKCLSVDLKAVKIHVVCLHPGWVRTRMGGPKADIDVLTSVSNMLSTIRGINESVSGKAISYDGNVLSF